MTQILIRKNTVWPYNLVTCALFNTLHAQQYAGVGSRGGFSREKFFYVAFAGSAIWYLVPGGFFFSSFSLSRT
jgi:hypothetical protein